MLTAAYSILRDGTGYDNLGPAHFNRQDRSTAILLPLERLADLACDTTALQVHAA
jgi:transposase